VLSSIILEVFRSCVIDWKLPAEVLQFRREEEGMTRKTKANALVFLGMVWFLCGSAVAVLAQEDRVRAKIGIQIKSGDWITQAKSRDKLTAGDLINIYVHPEASSLVYVVYTDHKTVKLLTKVEQRIQSSTLVLPSVSEAYSVDGNSPDESFTIICSPTEIKEISAMQSEDMPYEKWHALERQLLERSRIDVSQEGERPFPIIGNVRANTTDPFLVEIPIYSGREFLVKKYDFRVTK
jgi:hypothetical protein